MRKYVMIARWVKLSYVYVHSTLAGILKSRVNIKSLFVMLQYEYKHTIDRYANLNS